MFVASLVCAQDKQLKEEVFILGSQLEGTTHHKAADHTASTARKQREANASQEVLPLAFPHDSVWELALAKVFALRVELFGTSGNLNQKLPHEHAQNSDSWGILEPVMLSTITNPTLVTGLQWT